MKKFLALLLSFVFIFSFSSCDSKPQEFGSNFMYLRINGTIAKIDVATATATPLCPDPICEHLGKDCPYSADSNNVITINNGEDVVFIKEFDGNSIVCKANLKSGEVKNMFETSGVINNFFVHGERLYFPNPFVEKDNENKLIQKSRLISAPISDLSNYSVLGDSITGLYTYLHTDESGFVWMTEASIVHSDFDFSNIKEYVIEGNEHVYGYGEKYLLFDTQEQALYTVTEGKKEKLPYSAHLIKIPDGAFVVEDSNETIGVIKRDDGTEYKVAKHFSDAVRYFDYESGSFTEVSGFEKFGYYNIEFDSTLNCRFGDYVLLSGDKFEIKDGIVTGGKPIYIVFNLKTGEWKRVVGLNAFQNEHYKVGFCDFDFKYDD